MKLQPQKFEITLVFTFLAAYLLGYYSGIFEGKALNWYSDIFWTIASFATAWRSWLTAKKCTEKHECTAWKFFSLAAFSWFIGMLIWSYFEIFASQLIPFPSIGDWFFMGYALFFIVGLFYYRSQSRTRQHFMLQVANLGLIITTVTILCYLLLSPTLEHSQNSLSYELYALFHAILTLVAFIFALYCYWFYIWNKNKHSFEFLLICLLIFAVTDTLYAFQLLGKSFNASSYLNVYWLLAFSLHYLGAIEQDKVKAKKYNDTYNTSKVFHISNYEALMPSFCLFSIFFSYLLYTEDWEHFSTSFVLISSSVFIFFLSLRVWYENQLKNTLFKDVKNRELQTKAIMNTLPDLVWLKNIQGIYLSCNHKFERFLGKKEVEIVGKNDYDLVNKDLADLFSEGDKLTIATGRPSIDEEELVYNDDGHKELVETIKTPFFSSDGKLLGILGIARDITERKQSEERIKILSLAIEQSPNSIVITDIQGNIEYVNQSFITATGFGIDEVIGKNPRILKSGKTPNATYTDLWQQIQSGKTWYGEFINLRKNGQEYSESAIISAVKNEQGEIVNYLAVKTDISKEKAAKQQIDKLSNYDSLTGLPNKVLLLERFKFSLINAARRKESMSVMMLDVDNFKQINDTLGHSTGDQLLVMVAMRLQKSLRENDTISRTGGDEFVLILPNSDAKGAAQVATHLINIVSQTIQIEHHELIVTPSIGISVYPNDGKDFDTLLRNADAAMYQVKQDGRNAFRFFTPEMQKSSERILSLTNSLRQALRHQQFYLLYQPQLSISDGKVIGAEALIRWNHPELGLISPAEFIPLAEDTGQIVAIGEWVIQTAAQQMKDWLDAGLPSMVMAVNLSSIQFRQAGLDTFIVEILDKIKLPHKNLELELTEGVAMNDPEGAIKIMDSLHNKGLCMSVDDFGTGYSSLSYLKKFKVYKLKIDQSFVRDITIDNDDKAIVTSIINLAKGLGIKTIAEGVETSEQLAFLKEKGCDEVQGYYFSKPIPAQEFSEFVKNIKSSDLK